MRITALILLPLVVTAMTAGADALYPRIEHATIEDQPYTVGEVLYEDDFSGNLLNWRAEGDIMPKISDGRMECETKTGLTTWFKTKLSGDIMIEYERQVWAGGGPNDHSRDVNCFWMALDPTYPNDFWARSNWRGGAFKNYATLSQYYVGYGGGNNTTCRFRRYTGLEAPPPPIQHYDDNPHYMIVPSHTYKFQLVCFNGLVQYIRDGEIIFELQDADPYTEGYFGFRTVRNHEFIDNFRVRRLLAK